MQSLENRTSESEKSSAAPSSRVKKLLAQARAQLSVEDLQAIQALLRLGRQLDSRKITFDEYAEAILSAIVQPSFQYQPLGYIG